MNRALLLVLLLVGAVPCAAPARADDAPAAEEKGEREAEKEKVRALADDLKSKDATRRREAAAAALEHPSADLVDGLAALLKEDDAALRFSAIDALAVREEGPGRRRAAQVLAGRLTRPGAGKDLADETLRVINALHDLAEPSTMDSLLEGITETSSVEETRARLRAVANVPKAEAIESLIQWTAKGRRGTGHWGLSAEALRYATGHDARNGDPDVWRAWWRENGKSFDFEAAALARARERAAKAEKERRKSEAEEKKRNREEGGNGEGKRKKKGDGGKKDEGEEGEGGSDDGGK